MVFLNGGSLLQPHPEEPSVCSHSRCHAGGEFTHVGDCPDGLTKGVEHAYFLRVHSHDFISVVGRRLNLVTYWPAGCVLPGTPVIHKPLL